MCLHFQSNAQQTPIGQWRTHFSNNQAYAVESLDNKIYFGENHLLEYDVNEKSFTTYDKTNGLNDINIRHIRFDAISGFMIIVYENSNIDLLKQNIFYNMPQVKDLNITGSKKINAVYFHDGLTYLSADFGIVVLNPTKKEIKETYILQENGLQVQVMGFCAKDAYFYAATSKGIFSIQQSNPNPQDFTQWVKISSMPMIDILATQNAIFSIDENKMYSITNQGITLKYAEKVNYKKMRNGQTNFYVCESGNDSRKVSVFDSYGNKIDSVQQVNPYDMVEKSDNEMWVADNWQGAVRMLNKRDKEIFNPKGIANTSCYSLGYSQGDIFVAGGSRDEVWNVTYNPTGISRLKQNGDWVIYNRYNGTSGMDQFVDVLETVEDTRNGNLYAASIRDGLWEWHPDNTSVIYKNTDYIKPYGGSNRLTGLIFDKDHNLWMSNYASDHQLVVKKNDGTWQKFSLPYPAVQEKCAAQIVIDEANQKWIVAPRGIGLFVMNDNNTIDNKNDDKAKLLKQGKELGNLPANEVNCIEKDKTGKIWVGTSDGIGIFNCPEAIFNSGGCDAEIKIVKYDKDAGELFQGENVLAIATDGANNKWIGTGNGLWLISDDAEKILNRFTTANSPLPSNEVTKILVHPITGEVFIITEKGLVSYRAFSTDGKATNEEMLIFPNPVPADFTGIVAIKGLVDNADVRITDVSGQLVFRTKAQGGQAIWNGKNYIGKRPRTGVYYVFVTNVDGSKTKTGKFIFNE
jgi:hypothetical protein